MKKLILLCLLLIATTLPSRAVLTEKNLDQTLEVLTIELSTTFRQLRTIMDRLKTRNEMQHQKMINTMQRSNQIALMLYSQNSNYTFNLAYACHEAAEQYLDFTSEVVPYDRIMEQMKIEIQRYSKLEKSLMELPPSILETDHLNDSLIGSRPSVGMILADTLFVLNEKGQANRQKCLMYTRAIQKEYQILCESMSRDSKHYKKIEKRLKSVFDYAQQRYQGIQKSIFINGEDNYFTILSRSKFYIQQVKRDVKNKYSDSAYADRHVKSEWRGPIIFGLVIFVTFYFVIAFILSNLVVRLLMKKVKRFQKEDFRLKVDCIIAAASLVIFALAVMIVHAFLKHSFIIMASQLLVSFAWLMSVVLISLIIRLKGHQIASAMKLYMPIIVLGFIVIVFRIILIPNSLVNLIFPPILLLFTLWQAYIISKENKKVPTSDRFYTWISLVLMIISCIMAWSGYVLMSVQVFIWWLIQLTLIQTITCVYDWLCKYKQKKMEKRLGGKHVEIAQSIFKRDGANIQHSWFFDFIDMVVIPVVSILSVVCSVYYAAEVFDLTEICTKVFFQSFINVEGICHCSIYKIVLMACLFFVFNYAVYVIKATYHYLRKAHLKNKNKNIRVLANQVNFSLFDNVTAIVIWGIYIISLLTFLQVPKSGLSIVSAGLATGVGFAMKGLIENFFYGLQLITGRLRVGDWIECDGVRGTVDSITYQSTQIVTNEGQVIAFLNSTLFNKNFMNLTRNHLYEMSKIRVGVAYGININEVRKFLVEAIEKINKKGKSGREILQPHKKVSVLVNNFGESSIDLIVVYWCLVDDKIVFDCLAKEAIYNVLKENHVEIPFPQRDLNLKSGFQAVSTNN